MKAWSAYQQAIFSAVAAGDTNLIIEAVAGSGKSTTILEAMKKTSGDAVFLAFNKSIADELKAKGVDARTFHSLCFSTVLRNKNIKTVDTGKMRRLTKECFTDIENGMYANFGLKLVGLAKQSGVGFLVADIDATWYEIAEHHGLELDSENASYEEAIAYSRKLLQYSNSDKQIDFDDMLFLAVKEGYTLPKFDWVFVDEAQDTNAIQRAILKKILKSTSRLVAVGDPAQAIYGFRGADSNSLNLIKSEFDCKSMPLTVSYRCGSNIVDYAKQYVSHIEAAPNAKAGMVRDLSDEVINLKAFEASDLVVCRNTAPVVELGYMLLKNRVACKILGRDIGEGLKSLINKQKAKGIESLVQKLDAYLHREVEKAIAKDDEGKAQSIQDKVDSVMVLIDGMEETQRTIPALINTIDSLFDQNKQALTLCTIHKSKGLEADRVFWLNPSLCPSKWAKKSWQKKQEINLCYVAVTRAKSELVLIELPKPKRK